MNSTLKTPAEPFTDAQEKHRLHPDTFEVPFDEELAKLTKGDTVKLCTGGERFWVTITDITGADIRGEVDNDLVCTETHGLALGDLVIFQTRHIYSIYEK